MPTFTVPALLGMTAGGRIPFAYGALTRCGALFQNASARHRLCNSMTGLMPCLPVPRPRAGNAIRLYHQCGLGLVPFRSPLLRESLLLSFPRGTEMFQFPRFPPLALCVQARVTPHDRCRVSPFGHPRINARSTAPRGLSQSPTSFIGFRRQGIHRWLFVAWKSKDARARYGVLKGRVHRADEGPDGWGAEQPHPKAGLWHSLTTEQRRSDRSRSWGPGRAEALLPARLDDSRGRIASGQLRAPSHGARVVGSLERR